jgi:hypothetical protein
MTFRDWHELATATVHREQTIRRRHEMPDSDPKAEKIRELIGQSIIDILISEGGAGRFNPRNGVFYSQGDGNYEQWGGSIHYQGTGSYVQHPG